MQLIMLGTGASQVTEYYNTCFVLKEQDQYLLTDSGGGNTLLAQMKHAGLNWLNIKDIFITHQHLDHLGGLIWLLPLYCTALRKGLLHPPIRIFAHAELAHTIDMIAHAILGEMQIGYYENGIDLITVEDGHKLYLLGQELECVDLHAKGVPMFGYRLSLGAGRSLGCLADEPLYEECAERFKGVTYLMHEAFCLHSEEQRFNPHHRHHSTVKDACENARRCQVQTLILYHTEDSHEHERSALFQNEARQYFPGQVLVPDDLEVLELT